MNYAIILFVILGFFLLKYKYGYFSFVSAGFFAFLIYSIPAIVELKRPFLYGTSERYLVPVTGAPIAVVLLAWAVFVITLAALPRRRLATPALTTDVDLYRTKMWVALGVSLAGIVHLMMQGGILFFIAAREEQLEDYIVLIWRWAVVFGFLAAVLARHRPGQIIFLAILAIIFLQGDRTIAAIAATAFLVARFQDRKLAQDLMRIAFNYKSIIIFATLLTLIVFGKPIYLSVKDGDMTILANSFTGSQISDLIYSLEPFVTFDHISNVIDLGISIPFAEFLKSVLGNALVIPSLFGIETNLYNLTITNMLPSNLTYGVAGNYWAHAMSVGGFPMVAVFSFIFALSLSAIDKKLVNRRGFIRIGLLITGAVVAIYIHRNGLDNILSFVRQIFIASIVIHFGYLIVRKRPVERPRSMRQA